MIADLDWKFTGPGKSAAILPNGTKLRAERLDGGPFIVYASDERISTQEHKTMVAAWAEGQAFAHTIDLKEQPNPLTTVALEMGAEAYSGGASIYANPFEKGDQRNEWATGWLRAFGEQQISKVTVGLQETARAMGLMQSDLNIAVARVRAYQIAMDYIGKMLDDGLNDRDEGRHGVFTRVPAFIAALKSSDNETLSRDFPGWIVYWQERVAGLVPDAGSNQ